MTKLPLVLAVSLAVAAAACGKSASDKPAPAKPATGAPVAVEVASLGKDSADVDVYDFSDKAVAGYDLMFRYYDKDGKILKVKVGTPFEGTIDHMSMSGRRYLCDPGKWAHFTVKMLNVPAGAVRGEALADEVRSTDGTNVSDLWSLPPTASRDEWPVK